MTQVASRRRIMPTALAFLAALAASSAPVAQTLQGGVVQNSNTTTTQGAGGECGDDTAYNRLYGVQGVMLTQDQADAATGDPGVYRCGGCDGKPNMEECWLKPRARPLQAGAQQNDATSGASADGIPTYPSPGAVGSSPTPGAPSTAPNRTPPYMIAQLPPQTRPPPAQPAAQPPRKWNGRPPSCTGGGPDTATCTFTDDRGENWAGPQAVECFANTTSNLPFRAIYQIDNGSFSITTSASGAMIGHATLRLSQFYPANDPPAKTIRVDYVKLPSDIPPRGRETYCPKDRYTSPPQLNY